MEGRDMGRELETMKMLEDDRLVAEVADPPRPAGTPPKRGFVLAVDYLMIAADRFSIVA